MRSAACAAVSTSLENTHRWPAESRRSSPRLRRSSGDRTVSDQPPEFGWMSGSADVFIAIVGRILVRAAAAAMHSPDYQRSLSAHANRTCSRRDQPLSAAARANPVDWHPWGAEALELARREDKPILLSIGYSACHWCHVMAHESFEDPATARGHERAVREHQGRSRGATRPGQDLSDRASDADPAQRRLAADHVPVAARPAAVFRRHVFPEGAALRHAGFRRSAAAGAEFYRTRATDIASRAQALQEAFDRAAPPAASGDTR